MVTALPLLRRLLPSTAAQRWMAGVLLVVIGLLSWLAVPGPRFARAKARLAEAHAADHSGSTVDYVAYWIPTVARGEILICLLLLAASRWLTRPLPATGGPGIPLTDAREVRVLRVLTALTILWSAWANAPRLDFSLWGDEESTMRKSVVGWYRPQADGALKYDGVTWQDAFFRYQDPNNHLFFSILSKLSHDAFGRDRTKPEGFYFDERAMRLPVYLAGLGALAAVAWCGRVLGRPRLGMAAVGLLALHPWFVRYGVEARGYGLLLLFVPLAIGFLARAAQTGRWRWWLGWGVWQFLVIWSYPGALHILVVLNLAALAAIFLTGQPRGWRRPQLSRWFTANALGALLSTFFLAPCVQPLLYYLKTARMQGSLDAGWYADAFSRLTTGMAWHTWDAGNPWCHTWQQSLASHPVLAAAGLVVLGLTMLCGVVAWWSGGRIMRALLPAILLFPVLIIGQALAMGNFIYDWYLVPGLAGALLLGAGGVAWISERLPRTAGWAAGVLLIGAYGLGTAGQRHALRATDIEQMRQGTQLTRTICHPADPRIADVITLDIAMTTRGYDPASVLVPDDDPAAFLTLLRNADAAGKPVFAHFGHPDFTRSVRPQILALIDDPRLFERVAVLPGLDSPYTREIHRYRSGAAADFPAPGP